MKSTRKHKGIPVGVRLPSELVSALDAKAERMSAETGNPTSRADVIRVALSQWIREQKEE